MPQDYMCSRCGAFWNWHPRHREWSPVPTGRTVCPNPRCRAPTRLFAVPAPSNASAGQWAQARSRL